MVKKALLWTAVAVALIAIVGGLWFKRLTIGAAPASGQLSLAGLSAPVDIVRDSLGVPHVWARSGADAYFAQGYLHATDRLWQMEMYRRVAEGRLSELFGEATVDADRFLRTLGLARAARGSMGAASPEATAVGDAYVGGVNAAIDSWRGPKPPELVLLRAEVEPWDLLHTVAMEKIMAWDLSEYGASMALAGARAQAGDEAVRALLPRYPEWGVTILGDTPSQVQAAPEPLHDVDLPPDITRAVVASAAVPDAALAPLSSGSTIRASNAWVVGGALTRHGKPLVANDMHLVLNHPTIWYLIGLHAPGLDVVGMSLPGAPGVISGHTRGVAWGFTNAYADDSDFFIERVDPQDTTRYLTPDGSERFRVREERIRVRGRDEPVSLIVRETRHGPIMTPVESRVGSDLLAYRWVAHDPSATFDGLLGMNRANSVEAFVEALADFKNPHQNVVFADTAGSFGYWMAGTIPLRRSGRPPLLPVPGWTGEHDWVGALPFSRHPHVLNPQSGFVVTANNRQSRDSTSLLVSSHRWESPYRAQRITELIQASASHDAESMKTIQLDVERSFVRRYRGAAEDALRRAGLDAAAEGLGAWDGRADLESTDATIFYTWIESTRLEMRTRFYGGDQGYFPRYMVERALEAGGADVDSLTARAAVRAASAPTLAWGEAHQLDLAHQLGEVPLIGTLLGFGRSRIPRAGGPYTVNAGSFGGSAPPFRVTSGPSQRSVADLADLASGGFFILPGGQSGLPANRHSWDQLDRWSRGELWRLPLERRAVDERALSRLTLIPAEQGGGEP